MKREPQFPMKVQLSANIQGMFEKCLQNQIKRFHHEPELSTNQFLGRFNRSFNADQTI